MEKEISLSLAVSGWSGTGATTLSLLVAGCFEFRYFHVGGVFREVGKLLGYSEEGSSRPKFDEYVEPIIGPTIDKYRDYQLLHANQIIVDSDLGTFLVGKHPHVFSVFLKADLDTRLARTHADQREDAHAVLLQREEVLRQAYIDLWDIDIYSDELIDQKFNLVLDNSSMRIETELYEMVELMQSMSNINGLIELDKVKAAIPDEVKKMEELSKKGYKAQLAKKGLIYTPQEMIQDITKVFPEDIAQYPENVREIFLGR